LSSSASTTQTKSSSRSSFSTCSSWSKRSTSRRVSPGPSSTTWTTSPASISLRLSSASWGCSTRSAACPRARMRVLSTSSTHSSRTTPFSPSPASPTRALPSSTTPRRSPTRWPASSRRTRTPSATSRWRSSSPPRSPSTPRFFQRPLPPRPPPLWPPPPRLPPRKRKTPRRPPARRRGRRPPWAAPSKPPWPLSWRRCGAPRQTISVASSPTSRRRPSSSSPFTCSPSSGPAVCSRPFGSARRATRPGQVSPSLPRGTDPLPQRPPSCAMMGGSIARPSLRRSFTTRTSSGLARPRSFFVLASSPSWRRCAWRSSTARPQSSKSMPDG